MTSNLEQIAEEMSGHVEICQTIRDHVCPAGLWAARLRSWIAERAVKTATETAALRKVRDEMVNWEGNAYLSRPVDPAWLAALDAILKERE